MRKYLVAGKAINIPIGDKGLWYIRKPVLKRDMLLGNGKWCPRGCHTKLLRWTDATIHLGHGECVMSDDPGELAKHLNAARCASGRVLVTGLGLGCVLRMLQANERVESITLVEISRDVIDLVWPHTSHERIELVHADALEWLEHTDRTWDYAWHDVWTDTDRGEPALAVFHQRLMLACRERTRCQGAWNFPRAHKIALNRLMQEML
jgi:hypothetical protein